MSMIRVKDYTFNNGKVEVYRGGRLTLRYYSRIGRFNLLSDEENYSCHIAVYEGGNRLMSANTSPDYELDGTDVDEAVEELQREIDSHWIDTARTEKERLKRFLKRYQERIEHGNDLKRLEAIDKELKNLEAEKLVIKKRLPFCEV